MSNIQAAYDQYSPTRFPLPSEQQVAELENRLKIRLPEHYRQFILEFNGGCFDFEPYITRPREECPQDCLNSLWGIGATYKFAELGHDTDLFDDNDPPMVLPIGYTMMGNLLYLFTEEAEARGCVCMKLMDCWTSFVLADTMEEFFGLLKRERPME